MAAAFRTPGTIGEAPRTVTVDGPCLVLLRRQAGLLQVAVSDPTMSARAPVGLQVAGTSGQAIRSDPGVTMVSDASGLRLRFDLSGSAGATLVADVRSPE